MNKDKKIIKVWAMFKTLWIIEKVVACGLKKFINLSRWYEEISKREAVQKGYDLLKKGEIIPKA